MPFDSDDKIKKRAAALKYKVVKQLVEFYFSEADTGVDFNYCQRFSGEINDPVLGEIATADIVIVILGENVNVTYELAFRHTLRGQMIIIGDPDVKKPKYIDDLAFIGFARPLLDKLQKQAGDLDNFPNISFQQGEISPGIVELLENRKETFQRFSMAMEQVLDQPPKPSRYIKELLPKLYPDMDDQAEKQFSLSLWGKSLGYPLSVLKIEWKGISDPDTGQYTVDDMIGSPLICDANWAFIEFYQLNWRRGEEASEVVDRLSPLDYNKLKKQILKYKDDQMDIDAFESDQARLTAQVIFVDEEAATGIFRQENRQKFATQSILWGANHPTMAGQFFLPCLLARRHEGEFPNGKHNTYLLVAYVEVSGLSGAPVAAA